MTRNRTLLVAGATLAGLSVGWLVAQGRQRYHREDLFSRLPARRAAALGYLRGRATAANIRLLQDYLRWEQEPSLRRRATLVVRQLEARLR